MCVCVSCIHNSEAHRGDICMIVAMVVAVAAVAQVAIVAIVAMVAQLCVSVRKARLDMSAASLWVWVSGTDEPYNGELDEGGAQTHLHYTSSGDFVRTVYPRYWLAHQRRGEGLCVDENERHRQKKGGE